MAIHAQLYALNTLAVELGKDRRTLARKLDGLLPDSDKIERGKQVKRWRLTRVLEHINLQGAKLNLEQERARLARVQCEKIDFELARLRGSSLDADATVLSVSRLLVDLRTRLLAIPTKAAPLLLGCRTIPRLKDELERQIHDALRDIANTDVARYLADIGGRDDETATEIDDQPVGRRAANIKPGRKRGARRLANR